MATRRSTAAKKSARKRSVSKAVPVPTAERWTAECRATFLAALAELANVAAAARVAGVPERSPHYLKQIDPDFAAAWDAAIDEGYNRLELLLLRRATYGDNADGDDAPTISTSLALGLLKARQTSHRRTPRLPQPMYGEELRDELTARLAAMRRGARA